MTEQDKQLLLKDLCARLPYNPYIFIEEDAEKTLLTSVEIDKNGITQIWYDGIPYPIETIKPYLRSTLSITEEECRELGELITIYDMVDYMLAHHFDVHNLIEKELALEAPKGMYNKN